MNSSYTKFIHYILFYDLTYSNFSFCNFISFEKESCDSLSFIYLYKPFMNIEEIPFETDVTRYAFFLFSQTLAVTLCTNLIE